MTAANGRQDSQSRTPGRKAYAAPRLEVYGSFRDLTLTEVEQNPMNDMFGNYKTI